MPVRLQLAVPSWDELRPAVEHASGGVVQIRYGRGEPKPGGRHLQLLFLPEANRL